MLNKKELREGMFVDINCIACKGVRVEIKKDKKGFWFEHNKVKWDYISSDTAIQIAKCRIRAVSWLSAMRKVEK